MALSTFPKVRAQLPLEYQKIYDEHYYNNREGGTTSSSITQKMEEWLHKKVASDVKRGPSPKTLEIGAGTLNQLNFEEVERYDIIEPYKELYLSSQHLSHVTNIYDDIDDVPISERYNRITSIATFEHITDLPKVVAKTCLLLNEGGTLRTSIPNEGTLLWRMGWMFTSAIEFKLKYGLKYETLLKYEHVNNAKEVDEVLHHFYDVNHCSVFGLSKNIGFYRFYESSQPNVVKAREYLVTLREDHKMDT